MNEWMMFVQNDLIVIFTALETKDWTYPFSIVMMAIIFFMPLPGIDRRDLITGMMYVVYCLASGTILFFAVPEVEKGFAAFGLHLAFVTMLGAAAFYRWFHSNDQLVIVASTEANKAKSETSTEMQHEEV